MQYVKKKSLAVIIAAILTFVISCSNKGSNTLSPPPPPVFQNSSKDINSFIFTAANNTGLPADISGNVKADSILVTVPYNTNVTNLMPTITISGVSVTPASLSTQNFSSPVSYTVKAQDGTTKKYTVVVAVATPGTTLYINSQPSGSGIVGKLYAIDANTGVLEWEFTPQNLFPYSSPTFLNGIVYVTYSNEVIAFDTLTKNIKWQFVAGNNVESTPTIVNNVLYVNCDDHYLYALDATNGSLKWKFAEGPLSATLGNVSNPTVVNGVAYFGKL